jgi:hypothetical protein
MTLGSRQAYSFLQYDSEANERKLESASSKLYERKVGASTLSRSRPGRGKAGASMNSASSLPAAAHEVLCQESQA